MEKPSEDEFEAAALKVVENFGTPEDVLHVEGYGWILIKGEPTSAGLQWYRDHYVKTDD